MNETGPLAPYPGMELTDEMRAAVGIEERWVPGPVDAPDVRVLLYRPKRATRALPLVVSMHGGAFARRADNFPAPDALLAMQGALVVSVDYRVVPEHPFPCGIEDCYAALCWAVAELDIDRGRVVVTGTSAGGALAAALTLLARDRNGPAIAFQALVIPVLDDRCGGASMRQFVEAPLFGAAQARTMWSTYLGPTLDRTNVSPYAAPARATDLTGLPPAFIRVNSLDPLRDEGIEYALRLLADGVEVELYCAPGLHHDLSGDARAQTQAARVYLEAMRAAMS